MYFILLILATAASIQARTFNNPILSDQNYFYPGAIRSEGIYVVVTSTPDDTDGIFTISYSTNLTDWKTSGHVFFENNMPTWAKNVFDDPEIHKIGNDYLIYFSALTNSSLAIGAAIAKHPLGPYTPVNQPILLLPKTVSAHSTIINDEGNLYLVWRAADHSIYARQLNSDGLSFSSDQATILLKPSLTWETYITSPWYFRRGSYHYLMYTGGGGCSVGVARSRQALGPYEKQPNNPILIPNNIYKCTSDVSLVKDLDLKNDIIFFTAFRTDDPHHYFSVILTSVGWDDQDWPYIEEY